MAQLKILLVEDELIISQDISFKLQDLGYNVVGMATTYDEAIDLIEQVEIDLVLLDINLIGEKDGIDVALYINQNKNIPFIYLTSNADFSSVSRAKETSAKGYILKPIQKNDLFTSIEIALSSAKDEDLKAGGDSNFLFVQDKEALVKVGQNEMKWLKAEGNYTKIFTDEKSYLIRGSVRDTKEKLGDSFCRIHKSYVVNLAHIDKITHTFVYLGENELPIGKMYKEELLDRINKL